MAIKKRQDEGGGEGSWLNTYADMITLVLTFFIALFSMSTLKEESFAALVEGLQGTPASASDSQNTASNGTQGGGEVDVENERPKDFGELYEYLNAYVEQNGMSDSIQVSKGENSVYIRLSSAVFFKPDKYLLLENSLPTLDFLGECIKSVEDEIMMINVYGHTALVPDPNYPVNATMLSSERAAAVKIYMEDADFNGMGPVESKKINSIGQGGNYPIASNDTDEGRKKNRRVELAIISNDATFTDTEEVLRLLQGAFDSDKYPAEGGIGDIMFPEESGGESAPASQPPVSTVESGDTGESTIPPPENAPPDDTTSP